MIINFLSNINENDEIIFKFCFEYAWILGDHIFLKLSKFLLLFGSTNDIYEWSSENPKFKAESMGCKLQPDTEKIIAIPSSQLARNSYKIRVILHILHMSLPCLNTHDSLPVTNAPPSLFVRLLRHIVRLDMSDFGENSITFPNFILTWLKISDRCHSTPDRVGVVFISAFFKDTWLTDSGWRYIYLRIKLPETLDVGPFRSW